MRGRDRRRHGNLLTQPEEAAAILARELGVTEEQVRSAYVSLIKAGYAIAPIEPTNAMMLAYVNSYGQVPSSPEAAITTFTKARRRWQAMVRMANAHLMSRYGRVAAHDTEDDPERAMERTAAAMKEVRRHLETAGPDRTDEGQSNTEKGEDDGRREGRTYA